MLRIWSENGWMKKLCPNEEFETVKCAITSSKTEEEVFDNITKYNRTIIYSVFAKIQTKKLKRLFFLCKVHFFA